jgi:hypothetical protein
MSEMSVKSAPLRARTQRARECSAVLTLAVLTSSLLLSFDVLQQRLEELFPPIRRTVDPRGRRGRRRVQVAPGFGAQFPQLRPQPGGRFGKEGGEGFAGV